MQELMEVIMVIPISNGNIQTFQINIVLFAFIQHSIDPKFKPETSIDPS